MFRFIKNRRPLGVGFIFGTVLGLMIAIGYGLTSAWLCSGIRKCPASWEPFVYVSLVIFLLVLFTVIIVAVVGARAYKVFDTSIGGDKAYEPSIGSHQHGESGSDA